MIATINKPMNTNAPQNARRSEASPGLRTADRPAKRTINARSIQKPASGNWAWFTRMFAAYSERLLRKNFHSVRVLGEPQLEQFAGSPLVIFANHPSWWDPLIGLVIWHRLLPGRVPRTPIDAAMLQKYGFFKWLGFFGVDKHSVAGARAFLNHGTEMLRSPDTLMLITPQGRFADPRESGIRFEPGLGHLAARSPQAVLLPLAMEITYWEEKRPEVLLRFGEPMKPDTEASPKELTRQMESLLADAARRLATASIHRESDAFVHLLRGSEGTNPAYDAWRRLKAAFTGRTFHSAHGTK